ncbi:MAG: hypothetical protein JWM80_1083 [Cyanobacteria bacterium RYN_339]|nr:hypothetical protein [Cyanobacteria bacterium RYN_339]
MTNPIPPQNLPGTLPINPQRNIVGPAGMPPPLAAPQMMPDGAAPGAALQAEDPRIAANVAVYAHGLSSSNPAEVSQSIAALDSLGPAYRDAAARAVLGELHAGLDHLKAQVLIDAMVRWNVKASIVRMQEMTVSGDPQTRAAASEAFGVLTGVRAPSPLMTAAPGAVQPAGPAQPAPQAAYGQPSPDAVSYIQRMKDPKQAPVAAVEMASLPGPKLIEIANALMSDPSFNDGKSYDLLSTVLCKRPHEPGMLAVMRRLSMTPGDSISPQMWTARAKAATTVAMFGTAQDLPDLLRFLSERHMGNGLKKVVIDSLAKRPDLLNASPAVVTTLKAVMDNEIGPTPVAAAHALSLVKSAAARDALGTSKILRGELVTASPDQVFWTLGWLNAQPAPYSADTVAVLQRLLKDHNSNKSIHDLTVQLLKKTGVSAK